jgi:hypothetical protein
MRDMSINKEFYYALQNKFRHIRLDLTSKEVKRILNRGVFP